MFRITGRLQSLRHFRKPLICVPNVRQRSFYQSVVSRNASALFRAQRETQNKNIQKWLLSLTGLSALSYGLWYFYWPHHTFPPSVAATLRKGLWAESDKEHFDYQKALKHYIEAIEECQKLKMDPISDEYTGIELKISEMYEKLNHVEQANAVYLELLYRYFDALSTPGKVPEDKRPDMIRRDLRVLIKSLEVQSLDNSRETSVGKRNLLAHLLLAQEEILSRSPELKEFFETRKQKAKNMFQGKALDASDFKTFVNTENIKLNDEGYMILDLKKNSSAWEPFKEEFFTARDLYTAFCLSAKDISAALSCKMTTVEWMVMADMPPGQILLSQANLGSLLYLQGEKFETEILNLEERRKESSENQMGEGLVKSLRYLHRNRDTCLKMASKCYDSVVQFAKKNNKLRFNMKDQLDPSVSQAIALSTYGLGVLNLHQGVLVKAEKLLKDSILMAKEIDFDELLKEAQNELEKTVQLKLEKKSQTED